MNEMRRYAFAQTYSPSLIDRFGVWLSAHQIRGWVPSFEGKRVGDFGCGFHAAFSRSILPHVRSLVLVDISLDDELKRDPKIKAIEGALPAALAQIANESLDVALCISVLEHLTDPQVMLSELYRVLGHEGQCLVNVPSWRGKRYLELSAFTLHTSPSEEMDDHKMYYDVRDLWPLLVKAGFAPSNIRCFPHKFGLNTFAACQKRLAAASTIG
jgi:2-polyprenyl-3-methyl-5-hydroxy-6-metoxy-1,4-benzoquinol methylase